MKIPGYTIMRELGSGGMATVYLARQDRLSREVALKVMRPLATAGGDFTTRFVKEGQIIAQLQHPQIVTIYDFDSADGYHYFSMEYLPGGTLGDEIRKGLPVQRAIAITRKIAEALAVAHARGVVHRDVKPQNILFRADGTPVLTDFGIARAVANDPESMQLTSYGMVIGSPRYMSPEQSRGLPLDARSDLYSLGVVFYEMLTNHLPYEADDVVSLAMKHCSDPIPRLTGSLSVYQGILDRLIAKTPEDRFANAGQLIRTLEALDTATLPAGGEDATRLITRPRPVPPDETRAPAPRPVRLIPLVLVVCVVAAGTGAYLLLRGPAPTADGSLADRLPPAQTERSPTAVRYEGLALDHFQKGQYAQSLEVARLGLSLTPDDARLESLKRLILARMDAERQREQARTLLRENQLEEGLSVVASALREIPGDTDLLAMQTQLRERLAARTAREAATLLEGARADLAQGRLDQAADTIARVRRLAPRQAGLQEAESALQAAQSARKALEDVLRQATDLLAAGSAQASLDLVERALAQAPTHPRLLDLQATARQQLQQQRQQELAALLERARSQKDQGALAEALATVDAGLARAPDHQGLRDLRGEILAAQTQVRAHQADALLARAKAAAARQEPDEALALVGQGLALAPDHQGLLALRERVESARERAARIAQQLADCDQRFPTAAQGTSAPAADCYAAILRTDATNQQARERLRAISDGLAGQVQALLAEHRLERAAAALDELRAVAPEDKRRETLASDLERRRSLSPALIAIPGGCYQMGSPTDETGREDDEHQHQVCVGAFRLAPVEVSVAAFRTFVKSSGYHTDAERGGGGMQGCWALDQSDQTNPWRYQAWADWRKPNKRQANRDQDPVSCVSWNDALAYLTWLNQQTGAHYRLPTEAEWEYAARAGSAGARYWGDGVDDQACRYANTADGGHGWSDGFPCDDGQEWVAPVGSYQANAWGLKDMLGNLWEWTCSEYDATYDGKESVCAPGGADGPRILRGGAWNSAPGATRSAYRNRNFPESRYSFVGFRVAADGAD